LFSSALRSGYFSGVSKIPSQEIGDGAEVWFVGDAVSERLHGLENTKSRKAAASRVIFSITIFRNLSLTI
jgi:hypothetical protein